MKISPKFMKNAEPQDVVIVLGVFVLIISIIVLLHWAAVWEDQMSEREAQNKNAEARCKTVGGEMGYSKCYKDGKEI
jgi:hypothetical protein